MTDQNNAAQAAEQEIDAIMEQAQVFASAWSFLGGPFDNGSGLETAERERAALRTMLSKLRAEGVQAKAATADATLPDVLPELMTEGGAQYVSMATMQTVLRAARAMLRAPVADERPRVRPPMCRISGVSESVLRRGAMRHRAAEEMHAPSALAALADGLESITGNENAELAAAYIRREADRLASAQDAADVHSLTGETGYTGVAPIAPVADEFEREALRRDERLREAAATFLNAYRARYGGIYGQIMKHAPLQDEVLGLVFAAREAQPADNAAPQASEAVPMHKLAVAALNDLLIDIRAELGLGTTEEDRSILDTIRALKTKADKDGAVCSCPTGDGSLRWPCAVHRDAEDHR